MLAAHGFQFALPAPGFALILAVMVWGLRRPFSAAPGMPVGLVMVFGVTSLVFISVSLALQKTFWARYFAPVFPFYVTLLGIAFAGVKDFRKPAVRWMPFMLCGLLVLSVLNLRLAPSWRKDDYRSAAQFARHALVEHKSVWWAASKDCATYYHLEFTSGQPEPGKAFCPGPGDASRFPPPDVIVYASKADIYDNNSAIQKVIEQNKYRVAARFNSLVIWSKSGELPENNSNPGDNR